MKIAIGVFAHNEGASIAQMLTDIDAQDIFACDVPPEVFVLSNGSTDNTVAAARERARTLAHAERFHVVDLETSGKSRTWNHFVHHVAEPADILICIDADIQLTSTETFRRLADRLAANPQLDVATSWPRKDLAEKERLTLRERLILLGGGTLGDMRNSLAGGLYALRGEVARQIYMPIGLPVEDGFLRAMLVTRLLTEPEHRERVECDEAISHVYQSESKIFSLVRHQIRLVVGSAVNAYIFDAIQQAPRDVTERARFLEKVSACEGFVSDTIRQATPTYPHGFVHFHFLTKRLKRLPRAGNLSKKLIILVGFGLDLVVYLGASVVLARNKAQGFW